MRPLEEGPEELSSGAPTLIGEGCDPVGSITHAPGDRIGRFFVLAELGRGGMGVVYKAYDPELDRRVALKLWTARAQGEETTETARDRVVREAQALARLSHPNVVAVYEVGTYRDGVFIAMELVEGQTARHWARGAARSWRDVLRVYLEAGEGLSAAHRAGLVHRDFKPDNVLVGDDGRVRVVDFGLARAAGRGSSAVESLGSGSFDDTESSSEATSLRSQPKSASGPTRSEPLLEAVMTRAGARIGTPPYMAPEQHEGMAADALSDQFSFCVSLFEALFGARPFSGRTSGELRRSIAEGPRRPPPGSPRVPAPLRRALHRGLSSAPRDRFLSMDALLRELRKGPLLSRERAAGVLLALGAATALVVTTGGRASPPVCVGSEQRVEAVWNPAVRERLRVAFTRAPRAHGKDTFERVAQLMDELANTWVASHRAVCEATHVRHEQSERLLDLRMRCLDRNLERAHLLADVFAKGVDGETLDKAVSAVLRLESPQTCATLDGTLTPPPQGARPAVEAAYRALDEAFVLGEAGHYDDGMRLAQGTVSRARELSYPPLTAAALHRLGVLQESAGAWKDAEGTLADALRAAGEAKDDLTAARALVASIKIVGDDLQRPSEALALEPAAEAAVLRAEGDAELRAELHRVVGAVLSLRGEDAKARTHDEASLALEESRGRETPELANALNALGMDDLAECKLRTARSRLERAFAMYARVLGPKHPAVALPLNNLALVAREQGHYGEAERLIVEVKARREETLSPTHPRLIRTKNLLAHTLLLAGRPRDARPIADEAYEAAREAIGPTRPDTLRALYLSGWARLGEGRTTEAEARIERASAGLRETLGPEAGQTIEAAEAEVELLVAQRKLDRAFDVGHRAAERARATSTATLELRLRLRLADIALLSARPNDAMAAAERAAALAGLPDFDVAPALRARAEGLRLRARAATGSRDSSPP